MNMKNSILKVTCLTVLLGMVLNKSDIEFRVCLRLPDLSSADRRRCPAALLSLEGDRTRASGGGEGRQRIRHSGAFGQ